MWFAVKRQPGIEHGARHFFRFLQLATSALHDNRAALDKVRQVAQNNSYAAHSESILLAMATDDCAAIRKLAYRKIRKFRQEVSII